jgi:hypothetical protein
MDQRENRDVVVGVFDDHRSAEAAVAELERAGFRDDQLGFARRSSEEGGDGETRAGEGAGTGALVGGILGAAAALLIPGVGPAIAGGILAPILGAGATAAGVAATGAVAGAAAGGLVGALAGLGIPEEEARYYQDEFEAGRTILTVKSDGRFDEARSILQRHGARDIHSRRSESSQTTDTSTRPDRGGWANIAPDYQERWRTRHGASGGRWEDVEPTYRYGYESRNDPRYRGRKWSDVETDIRRDWETRGFSDTWDQVNPYIREMWDDDESTVEHSVNRQEPIGERRGVNATGRAGGTDASYGSMAESAGAGRGSFGATGTGPGTFGTSGQTTGGGWSDVSSEYYNRWQSRYGTSGGHWEQVEPFYRYGYESSNDPRFRGRQWNDVESDVRSDWERRNPDSAWDRVRDFVRDAWEAAVRRA